MKNLTTEEFDKAPKVIQFLHISDISKIEVRNSIVNYPPTPKAMEIQLNSFFKFKKRSRYRFPRPTRFYK